MILIDILCAFRKQLFISMKKRIHTQQHTQQQKFEIFGCVCVVYLSVKFC